MVSRTSSLEEKSP